MLRVHELNTKFGPAGDQIDVEVVVKLDTRPNNAYGFTLRNDSQGPSHAGMLDLLRDAFNHDSLTTLVYDLPADKQNGILIRAWVSRPVTPVFDFARLDGEQTEFAGPEPVAPN